MLESMDWVHLGHAMWLATAGKLRLLFDPLIDGRHHGGVFEVTPRRTIDDRALRPDFILVSHRHPDHFDIRSLKRLAALDPDSVVVSPDDLVLDLAARLGFRTVRRVRACERVALDGADLLTTPSLDAPDEWGVIVASAEGVAWNQVDTVHRSAAEVRAVLRASGEALGRDLTRGLPLALVRWQPLLEVAAPLAEKTGFPFAEYGEILAQIAAIEARVAVPSSAGARHTLPYQGMNHCVYPVPEERALRDITARAPGTRALPARIGALYRILAGGHEVTYEPQGGAALVQVDEPAGARDPRVFRPFELPPLHDPNEAGRDEEAMRAAVGRWVSSALAPALGRAYPSMAAAGPLSFVLEVVFPRAVDAYTVRVDAGGPRVERRFDDDYDALNAVAGSLLCDVIEGARHWGDPLLGGMLRASSRAYAATAQGLTPASVAPLFVYYAISYEESARRALEWEIGHT
jgi:UDP-MurNAc hydroxylase